MWMNEIDIDQAVERFQSHVLLGKYARFLAAFRDDVNAHSDGWAYWKQPAKAADRLMTVLNGHLYAGMRAFPRLSEPTEAELKATLTPIKTFYAKHGNKAGMKLPELEGAPSSADLIDTITAGDWDSNALETLQGLLNKRGEWHRVTFTLKERPDTGALEIWSSRRLPQDLMYFAIHYTQGFVDGFSACASPDSLGTVDATDPRKEFCAACGHSHEDHDSDAMESRGCWNGSGHGNRCDCRQYEAPNACAVCGVSGPEHGHYDVTNPNTHKFVSKRLSR